MTSNLITKPQLNAPTVEKLDNGLTVIVEQMPIEAINLNVWLNVGSTRETDEINGMAHFLEHIVFKGTPSLKMGEFEHLIEERGAVTNAATSQDYTHYYITTAPKDFAELAPLQLDVALNPSIEDEAFEREKLVVLEEIRRSEDNPSKRTFYRSMETCFETLPYRRPVLGPASVIANMRSQQMRDFHASWYQPQSMTVVAVGNLPETQLIDIIAKAASETKADTNIVETNYRQERQQNSRSLAAEPAFKEIVRREYTDENLQQARLVMMWRVPGMMELEATYALDVLSAILGQGKVSRLFRDLREERGLVSQIGVSNMTQTYQGVFYISARLPAANISAVETAVAEHLQTICTAGVSEPEIARIRTQVANRFVFASERPSDRANLYGYYYSQLQSLTPALNYPDRVRTVTAEDLQAAAQKYLDPHAYGVVVMKPA
ncbi:pitrilysin family protein [Myxosarcina sp. GI1]|uniref:M16 family metallopeptidase n=1 Tax=Myxosarcina sp. GI1 TaxID=1541065 RepID=UPI00055C11AF|nr:pitrilysin family protein [Myxosarcina sp. GI1]